VPSVLFYFGDTSRTVPEATVLEIATRLDEQTLETKRTDFHQLALKIRATVRGRRSSDLVVTEHDIEMLWSVIDGLRKEKPGDEVVDFLWQALGEEISREN
jgi:hypothetical protein